MSNWLFLIITEQIHRKISIQLLFNIITRKNGVPLRRQNALVLQNDIHFNLISEVLK